MFDNLIESKRKADRSVGGTAFSVVAHAGLIALAVTVTANAGQRIVEEARQEDIQFVEIKPKEPPPPEPEAPKPPPPPDVVAAPPPPKGFQVLTAPIEIPDEIPEVDLTKAVTNEADFSGKGVAGGIAKGVVGGTAPVTNTDQPFFEFQVEKPVLPRDGNPLPKYPSMLESARVEGDVLVQFVVDTTGRVEMNSFKVLKSNNDLFSSSVKSVLSHYRFYPAEAGGRKVRQLVQMPFRFTAPVN